MALNVKAFMSGDRVAIYPEASALEAFDRMLDRGIRYLPVIDEEHRVVVDPAPFD
jgi:CBS domain-containing protein